MFATLIRLVLEYKNKPTRQVPRRAICRVPKGLHFDLSERLNFVIENYLEEKPKEIPAIGWFGSKVRGATRKRLLGAYLPKEHQIKIHRILDQHDIPEYFVDYVIYHEVLHALHPPIQKRGNKRKIHHSTFRYVEKRFPHYRKAKEWEKQNKHRLLTLKDSSYGRS